MAVRAINAKEIEIEFNKDVKEDTVIGSSDALLNITIAPVATADVAPGALSAELDKTGKVLTITAQNTFKGKYTVTVPLAVKQDNAAGTAVVPYTAVHEFKDLTVPTVTKLEYDSTNKKVVLTFSEPLKTSPTVLRVNGLNVGVDAANTSGRKVTSNALSTALAAGASAPVYAAGATDYADNEMALFNGTVTAPIADTTKPAITSVTQVSHDKIRVVFNRELDATSVQASDLGYRKDVYSDVVESTNFVQNKTVDVSGKTYDVTFLDSTLYGTADSATVTLILAKDKVAAGGYKNDAYSQSFTFTADRTAPKYVSYKVDDDKTYVDFTFDENLVVGTGQVTIISSDSVNLGGVTPTLTTVNGKQVLRVAKTLVAGTYNFSFPAGLVKDDYGNKNAAFSVTVIVGATPSSPAKPVVTIDGSSTTNKFVVNFDKEMGQSAVTLGNYKLDGNALPAGTTAYFTSTAKKQVTITLTANSQIIDSPAILTVSNVADKDGIVALTTNLPVTIGDNIAPTVVGAPVHNVDAQTITYKFSEKIQLVKGATVTTAANITPAMLKVYQVVDGKYNEGTDPVSIDVLNVLWNGTSNTLTVTYKDALAAGDYIVDAWGYKITDTSLAQNRIANIDDASNYLVTVG